MTTIYIDTNIIMNESFLRSPFSQAFLKASSLLQINVVIPDIVLDEVLGNYPKKLKIKAKEFLKAQKEIGKLIDIDDMDLNLDKICGDYEGYVLELIENAGIHIAPYPGVSSKDLVVRAYEAKKPFKDTGEGHKDFLVWETIKEHIEKEEIASPHFLITNNTKDFAEQDEDKRYILHPDLAAQLNVPADQLVLLTSLREAWEKLLSPQLEGMTHEDVPDLSEDDITDATSTALFSDLPDRQAFGFEGLPFSNDVTYIIFGRLRSHRYAIHQSG